MAFPTGPHRSPATTVEIAGRCYLSVALLLALALPNAQAGTVLNYRCVDRNGVSTNYRVTANNEYYLLAVMRTLGMRSVQEYEASGLDCRNTWEWAHNVVPLGTAPLKPDYRAADEPVPLPAAKPGPFKGYAMGDYLNAIYNGDDERVRRLDHDYMGRQVAEYREGMSSYGPFGKALTDMMHLDSVTLLGPAIRAYSSSYGAVYGQCLRADAIQITRRRVERDTGIVLSAANYQMNREFEQAFDETYSEPGISDAVEPYASIANGVHQVMASYRCNDPVIKQFERELLAMYNQSKSR